MLYAYKCPKCKTTEDRISSIAEMNKQVCLCGTKLVKDWSRVSFYSPKTIEYYDPSLGVLVGNTHEQARLYDRAGIEPVKSFAGTIEYANKKKEAIRKKQQEKHMATLSESVRALKSSPSVQSKIVTELKSGSSATAAEISAKIGKG